MRHCYTLALRLHLAYVCWQNASFSGFISDLYWIHKTGPKNLPQFCFQIFRHLLSYEINIHSYKTKTEDCHTNTVDYCSYLFLALCTSHSMYWFSSWVYCISCFVLVDFSPSVIQWKLNLFVQQEERRLLYQYYGLFQLLVVCLLVFSQYVEYISFKCNRSIKHVEGSGNDSTLYAHKTVNKGNSNVLNTECEQLLFDYFMSHSHHWIL